MALTDPLGDMLTRIRNGQRAKKDAVLSPASKLRANVLESAMPTMISAAALAMAHGLAPRLAAALVGYGIVLCLATLPAWAWLLARIA